ncbi:toxic anion resistance protein [Eubacteriales bacterium OttesenSCG-928-N13]|nr:toxic anion resistance protein [Eubacteriales bacterium OttesenSCG-928-N13]
MSDELNLNPTPDQQPEVAPVAPVTETPAEPVLEVPTTPAPEAVAPVVEAAAPVAETVAPVLSAQPIMSQPAPIAPDAMQAVEQVTAQTTAAVAQVAQAAQSSADESLLGDRSMTSAQDVQNNFTPQEQQMINEFSKKIDVTDSNLVFAYGASAQQQIASFSDSALKNVQTKDLGEVGDMITGLVSELKGFSIDDDQKVGGFLGLFKRNVDKLTQLKNKFDSAETNVNKITDGLEQHQVQLLKDIATLDQLYEENLKYFKELSMYIEAGKKRIVDVKATDLVAARDKATKSGLPEDAQAANDLANKIDRFEKKIYDLELTRNISIQMAPQIRLLQNSNQLMAEKIQSSLVNTIPLWKSQMVMAMGLAHTQSAMDAQREVTDLTNQLLKKNADMLHTATVETAKESERGIVDIETLKETNAKLIQTMDEVLDIQQKGKEQRAQAEQELANIESQLKAKLMEVRTDTPAPAPAAPAAPAAAPAQPAANPDGITLTLTPDVKAPDQV